MAKAKDLTGQRFGRLTVLRLADEPYISPAGKKTRRWWCRCDCGNEVIVLQNALTGKTGTRSCGCGQREAAEAQAQDLTGQRFGRLTVLHAAPLPKKQGNGLKNGWLCRCDCGKEVVRSQKELVHGHLQSCGCLLADTARKKVVEDNVLGHVDGTMLPLIRPGRPLNKNNSSGARGVYWSSREGLWIARIGFKGRTIHLGRFSSFSAAKKARAAAEEKYFAPVLDQYDKPTDPPQAPD